MRGPGRRAGRHDDPGAPHGERLGERVDDLGVAAPYDDAIDDVLRDRFEERYSVQFDSYPVSEPWLLEPARRVPARPTS